MTPPTSEVRFGACAWLILALAAIPLSYLAWNDQGIFWPDEIHQSLEPAHRFAFGYGVRAWEFQEGARSWVFPGLIGLIWKGAWALGLDSGPALIRLAKMLMVGIAMCGIHASMRLAFRLSGPTGALFAGVMSAAFPASLIYGHRAMAEMASGPLLVGAALLKLDSRPARQWAAGFLASLAIFLRYQNGLMAAGFLAILRVSNRRRDAAHFASAATLVGLAGGVLDWMTWGAPFRSFWVYVKFNLIEGRAADFGVEPPLFYVMTTITSTGAALLAVLVGLGLAYRRARGYVILIGAYVVIHSLVGHKEYRFLMPVVPLALALAGAGLGTGFDRLAAGAAASRWSVAERRIAAYGMAIAIALMMGSRTAHMTFSDMGQFRDEARWGSSRLLSPFHAHEAHTTLLWTAGAEPGVCGLLVAGRNLAWTGGYAYFHRPVPLLQKDLPSAEDLRAANYIIGPAAFEASHPEYLPVALHGDVRLFRRAGRCEPPDRPGRIP